MNDASITPSAIGDDTIELQLTPEQMRYLAQAEGTSVPACVPAVRVSALPNFAKMAAAVVSYGAFAWWGASHLAKPTIPPATAVVRPAIIIPRPAAIENAPQPVVRVKNPFDASEVFEFPAGTSTNDSHQKMAQILLERARERQGQLERTRPDVRLRTASLYPP